MREVVITPTRAGEWLYTVAIDGRVVVLGVCPTREQAEAQANRA